MIKTLTILLILLNTIPTIAFATKFYPPYDYEDNNHNGWSVGIAESNHYSTSHISEGKHELYASCVAASPYGEALAEAWGKYGIYFNPSDSGYYTIAALIKWRGNITQWINGIGFFDRHIIIYSKLQIIDTSTNNIVDGKTVYILYTSDLISERRLDKDCTIKLPYVYLQSTKVYKIEVINRVETYVHLAGTGGQESTGNFWSAYEPSWVQTTYIEVLKET